MPRTHLGRRIGDWLGIAPDDSEAVARSPRGGLMREPPAAISASPAFEREIAELHRVIADLRSGLDQPLDT